MSSVEILSAAPTTTKASHILYPELQEKETKSVAAPYLASTYQSTIADASDADQKKSPVLQPSKPELPRPKPINMGSNAVLYEMFGCMNRIDGIVQGLQNSLEKRFDVECARFQKFSQNIAEKWSAIVDAQGNVKGWGTFLNAVGYISSSCSFIAGTAMIYSGVGAAYGLGLVLAGLAEASNQLLNQTGVYNKLAALFTTDKTEQRNIATGLEVGTTALVTMTSVFCGIAISHDLIVNSTITNALKMTTMGTNITKMMGNVGANVGKINLNRYQMDHLTTQKEQEIHRHGITTVTKSLEAQEEADSGRKRLLAEAAASKVHQLELAQLG